MEERTEFKNLMYELYKKDYSEQCNYFSRNIYRLYRVNIDSNSGMVWSYDYFFSHYTALEYYIDRANIELRKRKIEKIKNHLK